MVGQKSIQDIEGEGAKKCPECGSKDLVKRDDEIYCKKCGFVLE
ncbi:MAG TPA: TFIIB-type zinc ribbon-containing protein [Candidatus Nanoarchaeia archaeon]|nr:TFIIB-type zinc ribbon-containing protein [Candidatus Nanoarchaeia archaeon]